MHPYLLGRVLISRGRNASRAQHFGNAITGTIDIRKEDIDAMDSFVDNSYLLVLGKR
jgi:hypothetical protein